MRVSLTDRQVAQLVLHANLGIATVRRVYAAQLDTVGLRAYLAVIVAARELGIPEPPGIEARIIARPTR